MMEIGDKVKAKIDLLSDLRDDGLGIEICAERGDDLFIVGKSPYAKGRFYVSKNIGDDYQFCVDDYEIEPA